MAAKSLADLPLSIRSWCAAMIAEMDLGVLNYQRNMSQHQIPLTYSNNPVLKYLYNLALRRLVLPKGYMGDIKAVRKRYSSIITEAYIRNSC